MIDTTPQQDRRRTHFEILSFAQNKSWVTIVIQARAAHARTNPNDDRPCKKRKYKLGFDLDRNTFSHTADYYAMRTNRNIDAGEILDQIRIGLGMPQQENTARHKTCQLDAGVRLLF